MTDTPLIGRRVQIDGLRALAMIGVLYVHFWNKSPTTEHVRVSLFFVVSGFIISQILMTARDRGGRIHILNFYARRALRLFPALFVLVALGVIFDMDGFRGLAMWPILQASNIYFAMSGSFKPWITSHLWSLNALEQFYLLWPIVILLLPLRRIYVLVLFIFTAMILVRVNGEQFGLSGWWRNMVFVSDPIAMGAFTCLLMRVRAVALVLISRSAIIAALLVLAAPFYLWEGFGNSQSYRVMIQPALAVLVAGAFVGYGGLAGWLLGNKATLFVSKISYAVYIYHLMIWWLVGQYFPAIWAPGPTTFAILSALTLLAATISWYALEQPISRLKRYFPTATFDKPAGATTPPGGTSQTRIAAE
ncbi:MAG: acyltransferase [Phaeovulum sp.]|uniref:acyltransferase family protein n=1 Tax=Phaeovulum sp. TaxID=2934796 RepID=UPI0027343BFE|nr:acyltransferase [Phaeovulum sp.]MDP3860591.1 acyltransferase [Phaeovulum sp.]